MEEKLSFIEKFMKGIVPTREAEEGNYEIDVEEILPNPYQPRSHFDVAALEELAASIKSVGVITPITVRPISDGYELVCGERRLRAAKIAGLKTIPAVVREMTDGESAVAAITENLQRKDLSFFETAESIKSLIEFHHLTQEEVAEKLGKSQAAIANKLRLLKLSSAVRRAVTSASLCERHARALLRLPTEELQLTAVQKISVSNLNVAESERLIQKMLSEEPQKKMIRREATTSENRRRLFKNTIKKTLDMLRSGGLNTELSESETEKYIEFIIKMQKS